jgi:hypothetical protein
MESRSVPSIGSGGRKPGRHQGEHRLARPHRSDEPQGVPAGRRDLQPTLRRLQPVPTPGLAGLEALWGPLGRSRQPYHGPAPDPPA